MKNHLKKTLISLAVGELVLLKRISNNNFAKTSLGKIYNHLRELDITLLYLSILIIIVNHQTFTPTIISLSIWIFAIIEYINYYKVRLSYKPNVLINYILHGKIRKSRIAREIENYKK